MATEAKDKKLLMMDEKIDELSTVVDKITAALAVLPALHNSLRTMHNNLLKINNDTQDLTNKMEVMVGIRLLIPAVGSMLAIGSEVIAATSVIAVDPILVVSLGLDMGTVRGTLLEIQRGDVSSSGLKREDGARSEKCREEYKHTKI
jgi:hypothetical protein